MEQMTAAKRKIINVAFKLFIENGYEKTTIQDIIDAVGMSKGAIYHYFKSKEEIFDEIWDVSDCNKNFFEQVMNDKTLTGLGKIEKVFVESLCDTSKQKIDALALPFLKNPKFLAHMLDKTYGEATGILENLVNQGIADGSIITDFPKEIAGSLAILTNFWINPSLNSGSLDEVLRRCEFLCEVCIKMGLELNKDRMLTSLVKYYKFIYE
ncbi:MAG: TetR/AcrR family transcriptional regulator [Oscillospiraceae bacterium]